MLRRLAALVVASAAAIAVLVLSGGAAAQGNGDANKLQGIDHIVVIYEENHSFDNLYGGWEGVRGLSDADAAHTTQLGQTGPSSFAPYECLYQDDANLQAQSAANPSGPLSDTCDNTTGGTFPSHFANAPFSIDDYLSADRHHVPAGADGVQLPERPAQAGNQPGQRPARSGARARAAARATSSTASTRSSSS